MPILVPMNTPTMALNSVVVKVLCLVVTAMVVAAAPAQAITCGQVSSSLGPCFNYLKGAGGPVPGPCCNGVRSVNAATKTPIDRQITCKCLKAVAAGMKGINLGLAAGLPGNCGVNVPYKISPSTNCDSVH